MSGKLDQSLDEILSARRPTARRGRPRRVAAGTKTNGVAATAPVGGVKKATRPTRTGAKTTAQNGPAPGSGESKIIVSNLVRPDLDSPLS